MTEKECCVIQNGLVCAKKDFYMIQLKGTKYKGRKQGAMRVFMKHPDFPITSDLPQVYPS